MSPLTLPIPDSLAKGLSDTLRSHIVEKIKQEKQISFADYMQLALYAPQWGYYKNGLQKWGVAGDFVTAPEISALFSYCLANQCADILKDLGGGDILEFGAGSGTMAADILFALAEKNQLPNHYYILEISAALKAEQQQTMQEKIPDIMHRVVWLLALPAEPIVGIILANEVLDAMPVHVFTQQDGIKECGVTLEDDQLVACVCDNTNPALVTCVEKYAIDFSRHYTSEINLSLPGWIKSVADSLDRGVVLLIDYGFPRHEYYHPDRSQGTLMCHYRHYAHSNALIFPGIQDITAHVDFTAVAEAACDNGLAVVGFTHQAAFLMNCGLLSLMQPHLDAKNHLQQNHAILKLTSPHEMGELFKVMALSKNSDTALRGFQAMNQVSRL